MPGWAWAIIILAGTLLLLLFLFRIRYRFDWNGGSEWSAAFEFGIPGLMRGWHFPKYPETLSTTTSTSPSSSSQNDSKISPVLFLLATDSKVLRALLRYALRFAGRTFSLLNLELDLILSHSNPATLGRLAGYWFAANPFVPTRRVNLRFDFEKQNFSLGLHAKGGFSAARALRYALVTLFSFPWLMLALRFWRIRRQTHLTGWRKRVYARI